MLKKYAGSAAKGAASTAFAWALLVISGGAQAEPVADDITVYSNGVGLLHQVWHQTIPAGRVRLALEGINPRAIASSARVGPVDGLQVRRQWLEYDLSGGDAMLRRYVGQDVELVRELPDTGETLTRTATLLAVQDGRPIYRIGDHIEFGGDDFPWRPRLPYDEDARLRPTLMVEVDSARAQHNTAIPVRYLTEGLSWTAQYVGVLNADGSALDLTVFASVENRTERPISGRLSVIAGDVYRTREAAQPLARIQYSAAEGVESVAEGDFYRYTFDEPIELPADSRQQLRLLEQREVPVEQEYRFRGVGSRAQTADSVQQAERWLRLENIEPALGEPLPAGTMRVYRSGQEQTSLWLGDAGVPGLAVGQDWEAPLGRAFDVSMHRHPTLRRSLGDRGNELGWRLELTNAGSEDVEVVVEETFHGEWRILESNEDYAPEGQRARWTVTIPAGEERELRYLVLVR